MSFDVLNRYSANHKPWDHVGNIIPDIEHSEGERPAIAYRVAAWLPVQFFDKYYENWMVVMPGKTVGVDPDGALMPGEYCGTAPTVTYTTNDITAGTIDVSTGLPCSFTGATKVVELWALNGILYAANTSTLAGTDGTHTSGFMGRGGISWPGANGSSSVTARYPIGVAPYAYLQWAGGDGVNPSGYHFHNYNMQASVAVLCDYVIKLPLVPATVASGAVATSVTNSALVFGTTHWHTRSYAEQNATGRYDAGGLGTIPLLATYPVVALALTYYPLAQNTPRTAITFNSTSTADTAALAAVLLNEQTAVTSVTKAGDYWVDYDKGVIFIYSSDGATLPTVISSPAGTVTITYYRNDSAPAVLSKFACVLAGNLQGGDFLKTGTGSNLVIADPASVNFATIMGQVIGFEFHPLDGLDRVKTAFNPPIGTDASGSMANAALNGSGVGLGQMDRMPGSADGGMPDLVNFAGAANTLVIINLVSR